jgi:hypothetical protein
VHVVHVESLRGEFARIMSTEEVVRELQESEEFNLCINSNQSRMLLTALSYLIDIHNVWCHGLPAKYG